MKKAFRFMLSLIIIAGSFSFAACGNKGGGAALDYDIVFADFEQSGYFDLICMMNRFGVISKNDNPAYVKSAKSSAKLQPMGAYAQDTAPYFYIPTLSERFGYDYTDFTKVKFIMFNIFNDEDKNITLDFGFVTKIISIDNTERMSAKEYELKPGWNEIVHTVDHAYIKFLKGNEDIKGIYFQFENAKTRNVANAPVLYLDNITLKLTEGSEAEDIEDLFTFDAGEICDFEKIYQRFIITSASPKTECAPEISVVTAASAGLIAPSGRNVLKVVTNPSTAYEYGWPCIEIPEHIMRASGFANIPESERGDYSFRYDVYAENSNMFFVTNFYTSVSDERSFNYEITAIKDSWITFSQPFNGIMNGTESEIFIQKPGTLRIFWEEYTDKGQLTFYFDNFRFEKNN